MKTAALILRTLALLGVLALLVLSAGGDLPAAIEAMRDPQRVVDTRGADVLVLYALQLLLVALCCWCAAGALLIVAGSLRPSGSARRWGERIIPRAGRRLLAASLGIGALTLAACGTPGGSATTPASTPPAYAASPDAFDWPAAPSTPTPEQFPNQTGSGGGPPATGAADSPAAGGPGAPPSGSTPAPPSTAAVSTTPAISAAQSAPAHLVAPGECLWQIAEAHLGEAASTADVAYFVDALYLANQQLIGNDPDVLPVGAALILPSR